MLTFSRLMMTNWKVHKFAANVNEFAANILFYPYSTMRISNDDLQIIIRGKGPSGADENFILISQSYTFRRGVRTTKEIHTSYSYLIMLIPETINVACPVLAHYRSCMLGQGLDLVQDLHLGPHKLVCLVTVTSVSISSQVNLTNSRLFHVLKKN